MTYPVPSLDGAGWINDPALKVDAILANYASTQYSQTILYRSRISSFSKDLQLCSQQWNKLPETMQQSLDRMFTAYFEQVDISVELDEESMNDETKSFRVFITGSLAQDGKGYDLSKILQVSKINRELRSAILRNLESSSRLHTVFVCEKRVISLC